MDYLAPLIDYVQCCASHRQLNVDLRHQFSDQPGPKYKFCVISIITLKRFEGEPETKNAELHKTVRQAVEEAGGSVESLQRALFVLTPSSQIPVEDPDIVILSNWQSVDDFAKFKSAYGAAHKHWAQGYSYVDLTYPTSQAMLKMRTSAFFNGVDLDISKPRDEAGIVEGSDDAHRAATLKEYSGFIDESCKRLSIDKSQLAQQSVVMWNWVKKPPADSPDNAPTALYETAMMTLISAGGGGPLYAAPERTLVEHESFDGKFNMLAGMVWPSLKFMQDTFDSQYFFEAYKNKRPVDTLCVAAVPLPLE